MDSLAAHQTWDLPASGPQPDGSEVVRVVSYNIRSLRDDRTAVVRVLRALQPDLVCIQESPRFWFPRPQAAWLARSSGLMVLSGGKSASGPLLLGRLRAQPLSVHDVWLPRTPGLHQRGFATTVVRLGSARPFSVTSCHLSLDRDERYRQFELLGEHLDGLDVAAHVVGGDFNEHPGERGWDLLASRLRDGWATRPWGNEFSSVPNNPHQRIDGVFATPDIEVLACGVPADGFPGLRPKDLILATDHLPVVAALRVR
ncbi:endonuclease/exonuclease/phosphatase family protein [Streptacidiphilus rugosus]|uniref:endonuclease/exonuclease/phosphatase family protein n=1 Tax=Streptacidiphilus rugosus TaxID=405783 RepID=UPI00056517CC|nr:endonuclease/exonuclease/phosphatase family protein [Streptacidiphilus rugosus]